MLCPKSPDGYDLTRLVFSDSGHNIMSSPVYLGMFRSLRATPFTSRILGDGESLFRSITIPWCQPNFGGWKLNTGICARLCRFGTSAANDERQVSLSGPDVDRLVQWTTPLDISGICSDCCVYLPLADENGRLVNDPIGMCYRPCSVTKSLNNAQYASPPS